MVVQAKHTSTKESEARSRLVRSIKKEIWHQVIKLKRRLGFMKTFQSSDLS